MCNACDVLYYNTTGIFHETFYRYDWLIEIQNSKNIDKKLQINVSTDFFRFTIYHTMDWYDTLSATINHLNVIHGTTAYNPEDCNYLCNDCNQPIITYNDIRPIINWFSIGGIHGIVEYLKAQGKNIIEKPVHV